MELRDICERSIPWLIGYEEAIIEVQSKKSSFAGDILAQSCTGPTFTYIHHTCVLFRGGHCAVCCVLSKIHSCVCLAYMLFSVHFRFVQSTVMCCPACSLSYLIIVADAADAVSVNFSGRCKFLLI